MGVTLQLLAFDGLRGMAERVSRLLGDGEHANDHG
jgi:hypothetical protein